MLFRTSVGREHFSDIIILGQILIITGSMIINTYKTFNRGLTLSQELQQGIRVLLQGCSPELTIIKNKNTTLLIIAQN